MVHGGDGWRSRPWPRSGSSGTGVVGLTQLSSSDDGDGGTAEPASLAAITDEPADEPADDTSDDSGDDTSTTEPADESDDGSDVGGTDGVPSIDGEIVIDTGDGDPIVIDLGAIDESTFEEFRECAGLPSFADVELPDLDGLDLEGLDLEGLDLEGLDLDSLIGELDGPLSEWLDGLGDVDFPRYDGDFVFGPDGGFDHRLRRGRRARDRSRRGRRIGHDHPRTTARSTSPPTVTSRSAS